MTTMNLKVEIDYDLEIDRDFKRITRFLVKELELVKGKEHVDEVVGELLYISSTCPDDKTRSYINRKLNEFSQVIAFV